MTKAERLGKEVERRIEEHIFPYNSETFWDGEGKRIYSALFELVSFAAKMEKEQVNER